MVFKKIIIYSAILMVTFLFALVAFVAYSSSIRIDKTFDISDNSFPIPTSPSEIIEGKRLYISRGCIDCHGSDLSGVVFVDDPAIGRYKGSNLTKGKNGVFEMMTPVDFEKAVRHGVGKQGRPLIFMPSTDFRYVSDEDLGRMYAYIHSAPSIDTESSQQKIGPLARFLFTIGKMPVLLSAEQIDHERKSTTSIKPEISVEYGKYIATTCTGCHGDTLVGGPIQGAPPEWPPAQDITGKAIGKWTEREFLTAIKTGVRPDGSMIKPPMPWQNFSKMTDVELKALRLYLVSI
jgi:mono/diheme cytochrome c family protein